MAFWPFQSRSIARCAPTLSHDEIRKRARILVIDDDQKAFPVELLRNEGYTVEYWESVKNLKALETGEYDLIVLDIQGIATPQQSKTDGIGILEHIKQYNPAQLVIAYSAKRYDFSHSTFWKLADDYLGKPSSLIACKQRIDDLLFTRFSAAYYWGVLKDLLIKQEVSSKDIAKFEKVVLKRAEKRQALTKQELADMLKLTKDGLTIATTVVGLIFKLFGNG